MNGERSDVKEHSLSGFYIDFLDSPLVRCILKCDNTQNQENGDEPANKSL